MKLKFLVVPLSIIFSMVVAIWHIWPGWFDESLDISIKTLKGEIEILNNDIADIRQKKDNMRALKGMLDANSSIKNVVLRYYPTMRKEEEVLNKINDISVGSNLFLNTIKVEYSDKSEGIGVDKLLAFSVNKNSAKNFSDINSGEQVEQSDNNNPQMVIADGNIIGEYDQIKAFLTAIDSIDFLSNIYSFKIAKNEEEVSDSDEIQTESNKSDLLVLEAGINFGYLDKKAVSIVDVLNNPLFATQDLGLDFVTKNHNNLLEKYSGVTVEATGNANLFKKKENNNE